MPDVAPSLWGARSLRDGKLENETNDDCDFVFIYIVSISHTFSDRNPLREYTRIE